MVNLCPPGPQDLSYQAASQLGSPWHILVPGTDPPCEQDFAFLLAELHEVPASLFLQLLLLILHAAWPGAQELPWLLRVAAPVVSALPMELFPSLNPNKNCLCSPERLPPNPDPRVPLSRAVSSTLMPPEHRFFMSNYTGYGNIREAKDMAVLAERGSAPTLWSREGHGCRMGRGRRRWRGCGAQVWGSSAGAEQNHTVLEVVEQLVLQLSPTPRGRGTNSWALGVAVLLVPSRCPAGTHQPLPTAP